ncbi:MAG TPA: hypothetical protein VHN78_12945, partial [Chloroflexota bacterium]|nr:hypothetical protein [Chloroflexota bacterium]
MSVPLPAAAGTGQPPATELIYAGFDLRGVRLRNRVVMAAMTTGFASPAGRPTPRLTAWYEARAAGGAGLVIVEGTLVATPHPLTPAPRFRQHRLRLDGDGAVPAFRRLAEAIHRGGARAAVQLTYPAVSDPAALPTATLAGLAPAFAAAAARAGAAGFDAVEVQCSYRTLLAQLLSGATNRRQDKYGRRPAGRLRALLEIVAAIRAATGDRLPVLVKLSADEYLPRGLKPEQSAAIARVLAQAGCAGVEVIGGAVATD